MPEGDHRLANFPDLAHSAAFGASRMLGRVTRISSLVNIRPAAQNLPHSLSSQSRFFIARSAMSASITIPSPFDAHVHLRQGNMMKLVTPHVEKGGIRMAFVMVRLLDFPADSHTG